MFRTNCSAKKEQDDIATYFLQTKSIPSIPENYCDCGKLSRATM